MIDIYNMKRIISVAKEDKDKISVMLGRAIGYVLSAYPLIVLLQANNYITRNKEKTEEEGMFINNIINKIKKDEEINLNEFHRLTELSVIMISSYYYKDIETFNAWWIKQEYPSVKQFFIGLQEGFRYGKLEEKEEKIVFDEETDKVFASIDEEELFDTSTERLIKLLNTEEDLKAILIIGIITGQPSVLASYIEVKSRNLDLKGLNKPAINYYGAVSMN